MMFKVQRSAFPPNRINEFNIDTTNKYCPHIQPLSYKGIAQNYSSLNNPSVHNQNIDISSKRTCLKPYYTTKEPFGSVIPIEVKNSILPLRPIYI
jgi:hypothetical protein